MLYKLNKEDYQGIHGLFAALMASQPMCNAVLEGVYPGAVYVDDLAGPRTGYLQTFIGNEQEPQWGFLAGNPVNTAFNHDLNRALFGREIVHPDAPLIFCTCDAPDWLPVLESVFAPSPPVPAPRRHYVAREFHQDWHAAIPEGFAVEPLDSSLLQRPGLSVPEEVHQMLEKWSRIAGPHFADYGFVAIDTKPRAAQVAAWATVDFVAGGMGDLGMFTLDKYRKRGLAYVTTAAVIEHGLAHGLRQVCWTCMEDNHGSIRIAERLGLKRVEDYTMYVLAFDPLEAQSMLAYAHLEAGRPREALALLEGIIASEQEFPNYVLFDAARARVILGENEAALAHLLTLSERGSRNAELFEECPAFEPLHGLPEWKSILQRVRENREK